MCLTVSTRIFHGKDLSSKCWFNTERRTLSPHSLFISRAAKLCLEIASSKQKKNFITFTKMYVFAMTECKLLQHNWTGCQRHKLKLNSEEENEEIKRNLIINFSKETKNVYKEEKIDLQFGTKAEHHKLCLLASVNQQNNSETSLVTFAKLYEMNSILMHIMRLEKGENITAYNSNINFTVFLDSQILTQLNFPRLINNVSASFPPHEHWYDNISNYNLLIDFEPFRDKTESEPLSWWNMTLKIFITARFGGNFPRNIKIDRCWVQTKSLVGWFMKWGKKIYWGKWEGKIF